MSELEALTARAAELSSKADFWNNAVLWALLVTALAAAAIVVTQRLAFVRAKQFSDEQSNITRVKETDAKIERDRVATELAGARAREKEADARIAEAQRGANQAEARAAEAKERASKADERASKNEREAARLREEAEREHLARVNIEKAIQPRWLDLVRQQKIWTELAPFAGTRVTIETIPDFEARRTAELIASTLGQAGWKVPAVFVKTDVTRETMVEFFRSGIRISANLPDFERMKTMSMAERQQVFVPARKKFQAALSALIQQLNDNGIFAEETAVDSSAPPDTIRIVVSLKPIPGEMSGNVVLLTPGSRPVSVGMAPSEPPKRKP